MLVAVLATTFLAGFIGADLETAFLAFWVLSLSCMVASFFWVLSTEVALTEVFDEAVLILGFWRRETLPDLLPEGLEDRLGVADGDALSDFVRLENDSLIARNSFSQRRLSPQTLLLLKPPLKSANSDKSIINNRLAWTCQFLHEKRPRIYYTNLSSETVNYCLDGGLSSELKED